jgi:hypothetical protein
VSTCYWIARAAGIYTGARLSPSALLISAFHFPFIALTGYYLAETVFTAIIAVLSFLVARDPFPWPRRRAAIIGALAGASLIWKSTSVAFVPLLGLWTVGWCVHRDRDSFRQAWRCWVPLLGGLLVVVGAQTLYFYRLYGVVLPVAAGGGYNFALGKCPGARIVGKDGTHFQSPTAYYTGRGGVQTWNVYLYEQGPLWRAGLECVRRDPWVLVSSVREISYLFRGNEVWPVNTGDFAELNASYRRRFLLFILPGVAIAVFMLARAPFTSRTPPLFLVASVCVTSWLFTGEMRFRIPFDAVLIAIGVWGWHSLMSALWRDRGASYAEVGLSLAGLLLLGLPVIQQMIGFGPVTSSP